MKLMIKYFFLLILILCCFCTEGICQQKSWTISRCGSYSIDGIIRKNPPTSLVLIVNEKSKSESKFTIKSGELSKVALFVDRAISMQATVIKIDGTKGELSSIGPIKLRIPDPLHPDLDNGFILKKKMECEHE